MNGYVGSKHGSSAEELRQAAIDHGADALAREGLTVANLRISNNPILLHVRQPGQEVVFNHWILFLGCNGSNALVVDGTPNVAVVPLAEVLALWDGKGLVISRRIVGFTAKTPAWIDAGLVLFAGFVTLLTAKILMRSSSRDGSHRKAIQVSQQAFALLVLSIASGAIWHVIRPEGFLRNRSALGFVAEHRMPIDVRIVSVQEVASLSEAGRAILVDARLPSDFSRAHIPGAINIPITAGWQERQHLLARIPSSRNKTIIVYCQSVACRWSDGIASAILSQGHTDVAVFRGGFHAWNQSGQVAQHD